MLKYIPSPAQLKRWKNEITILLATAMAGVVSLQGFIEPLAELDPRLKGLSVFLGGLVARYNAYGKETVEVDLPAMAEEAEIDWAPDPLVASDWASEHSGKRSLGNVFRRLTPQASEGDL